MAGGSRDATAKSVLAPVLQELLKTAGNEGEEVKGAEPLLCLYYTEQVAHTLEVSQTGSPRDQQWVNVTASKMDGGIAEICDAAVEEAQRLFKRITGEDELFEKVQDDEDPGQEE